MPLADGQVQLRGLVMGPGTDYELADFDPWSRQTRADQGGPRAWNDGGWSGAEWAAEATVPMRIRVKRLADVSPGGWVTAHRALASAFAPSHDDLELRFGLGGVEYVMFGRPRLVELEVDTIRRGWSVTRAAFVGLDPAVYSGVEHQQLLGLPSTSGGLTVPDPSLNANPFFEIDVANWTALGGAVARSTAQFHEGVASLLFTPDGVTASTEARSENVPATVGTVYRASAWVRCAVARTVSVGIIWRDAGAVLLSSNLNGVSVAANTWTLIEITATAPASTAFAQFTGVMGSTPPITDLLYIDEARLRQPNTSGLTVPLTVDATVTAGRATITNAGTADVGLRLRIDGPVVEPRVSLLTPAGTAIIRMWMDLDAGQWLDVDTGARTVYLNGVASRRGLATADGIGWPVLPDGSHELAFDSPVYNASAQLTTTWRDAWH